MNIRVLLCAILLIVAGVPAERAGAAATINVTTTTDAIAADGFCSLREAVRAVNLQGTVHECSGAGASEIILPAGTYQLTIPGRGEDAAATGDLDLLVSMTITGATGTIIDANNIDRAVHIHSPAAITLNGITVQNGDARGETIPGPYGGGIFNNGGSLTLLRSTVTSSKAKVGAGIYSTGELLVQQSSVKNNTAELGYAAGIFSSNYLSLESSTVSGNTVANLGGGGAGIYLHSDASAKGVSISNSTISGNKVTYNNSIYGTGGGVWVYYQVMLTITNSTIAYNQSGQGGGLYNTHQQGALALPGADYASQALAVQVDPNITIHNTIIAGNTATLASINCGKTDQTGPFLSLGNNLESANTCAFSAAGDLPNTDPKLKVLAWYGGPTSTHDLDPSSPAVDSGGDAACPTLDQRGLSRLDVPAVGSSTCDIGAVEYHPAVLKSTYLPVISR